MKKCYSCKEEKPISEYGKNKCTKDGHKGACKSCVKIENKNYSDRKKKEMGEEAYRDMRYEQARRTRPNSRKYNRCNIDSSEKRRIWLEENKVRNFNVNKKWKQENKDRHDYLMASWSKRNRRGIRKYGEPLSNSEYLKRFFIENPELKLAKACAANIKRYVNTTREKYYDIIGCTNYELKLYLEQKFTDGMTWENHGKWHIDHIIPLCSAKSKEESIALNHHTNLQPLWAIDNLRKGKRIL